MLHAGKVEIFSVFNSVLALQMNKGTCADPAIKIALFKYLFF